MTKWYGLTHGGNMTYVGEHLSFDEADHATNYELIWLMSESGARQWLDQLRNLLEKAKP